jgi:ketosteroid isomerase-like protein
VSREIMELVRRALEAFNRGDMEAALRGAHPDLVTTRMDPDHAVFHGPEGMVQALAEWTEDFSDWSQTTEEVVDGGDKVIARVHQTARGTASGIAVEADFWVTFRPEGDRIKEVAIYADRDRAFGA